MSHLSKELASKSEWYPKEKLMPVKQHNSSLVIGVPKETTLDERRVCLTPDSVGLLVANGHEVLLEKDAGKASGYEDSKYSEKGAQIAFDRKQVFEANIVLKMEPPTLEEISLMKHGGTLLSAIQFAKSSKETTQALMAKKITALAFEWIEDKGGLKPIVRSMSEIAGNSIISIAGEYLSNVNDGQGIIFGGITGVPAMKVMIIGAGTIGENVTRIARQMGAEVQVYDAHHYKLRRMKKDLGEQLFTSMVDPITIQKEIVDADVVVGCLRSDTGKSLCVISEEMVASMKPGSIIIDASISQGGCVETSRLTTLTNPVFKKYDVLHYCVPNIASRVSKTATKALSYILTPMLLQVSKAGGIDELISQKEWFKKGVYLYKGCVTNEVLADRFELPYKNIDLFLAARF